MTFPFTSLVTCRWSFRSSILPTNTLGTSGASPRVLSRDSFTSWIVSNDFREIIENTKAYPWTPNEAFRDRREYSSYRFTAAIDVSKWNKNQENCPGSIAHFKMLALYENSYHSSSVYNVRSKMYFTETDCFMMCAFDCWVVTKCFQRKRDLSSKQQKKNFQPTMLIS